MLVANIQEKNRILQMYEKPREGILYYNEV